MPKPDQKKQNGIQPRFHSFSEAEIEPFTKDELTRLEKHLQSFLLKEGISLGEDRSVPESGGVPRIFVLALDAEGNEKPMSPQEAGIDMSPKSPEFWRQVAMGNGWKRWRRTRPSGT